jgi:hypothetical protein
MLRSGGDRDARRDAIILLTRTGHFSSMGLLHGVFESTSQFIEICAGNTDERRQTEIGHEPIGLATNDYRWAAKVPTRR